MDFVERKKKSPMPRADTRSPWMGLNGIICQNPVYWCRLHEVWLSEDDVDRKKCKAKLTYDMIAAYQCKCLERKTENPFLHKKEDSDG